MNELPDSVRPSLNGKAKGKRRTPPRPRTKKAAGHTRLSLCITVSMGCGIPLLSLSLSHLGGALLVSGHAFLGLVALGLCVSVLGVSLAHLAWAIENVTKSSFWPSLALAVAVDLSLVLCELVGVFAADAGVGGLRLGLMLSVTVASQALNTWAFLRSHH